MGHDGRARAEPSPGSMVPGRPWCHCLPSATHYLPPCPARQHQGEAGEVATRRARARGSCQGAWSAPRRQVCGWEPPARRPVQRANVGFSTRLLGWASRPRGPERGTPEGLSQSTSAPSPQAEALTQQIGWEGPGGGQTLFLWLLYFFGLWLFDNSSKNSV